MVKNSSSQTGSVHIVIIVILVVAVLGALGFAFWQNFMKTAETEKNTRGDQNGMVEKPAQICAGTDGVIEKDNVFCSESIGLEFKVPGVFADKFQKKNNYDVFQGGMESPKGSVAGKSLEYYEAVAGSEKENLLLSVAKEPLRSGYSNVSHALQRTYFDSKSGSLYLVKSPATTYDSATDTYKTTGGWSAGDPVPSFEIKGKKIYHGQVGDAGVVEDGYLTTVEDSIVVIKIKYTSNPMESPTIDYGKSFTDLRTYLKEMKFLK